MISWYSVCIWHLNVGHVNVSCFYFTYYMRHSSQLPKVLCILFLDVIVNIVACLTVSVDFVELHVRWTWLARCKQLPKPVKACRCREPKERRRSSREVIIAFDNNHEYRAVCVLDCVYHVSQKCPLSLPSYFWTTHEKSNWY